MAVENWDDDGDFDGIDLNTSHFGGGTSTSASIGSAAPTALSSRLSVASESVAGDDDWNVAFQPDDELSTNHAIRSAKQAGIPLPHNVPASALLGGTIKRLGKKTSRKQMKAEGDDWDQDLEMPDMGSGAGGMLQLKLPKAPAPEDEEFDDFDELEGSLGTRFAGTRRGDSGRGRSSSASAMSPSLGSVTAESEDDDLRGLELPEGPMDFDAMLKKRRATDAELSDLSQSQQPSPAIEQPATLNVHKKSKLLKDEGDDFLDDFDLGAGEILDNAKTRTINKNLKVKTAKPTPISTAQRPATTLNFHDKPTDKPMHMRSHLPRPVSGSKPPPGRRLEPVFESGANQAARDRRQPPTITTGTQNLRSKRSMPTLRNQPSQSQLPVQRPTVPFLPAGASNNTSHHAIAAAQRAMPYHLRRESDPNRVGAQSPPPRSHSRLSNVIVPDTPSRSAGRLGSTPSAQRRDLAPAALAREAAAKKTLTRPARRRNFGDGSELEIFDDLPTSVTKESKFVKEPVARGPPRPPSLLRQTQSRSDLRSVGRAYNDRTITPAPVPRTPASPTKGFHDAPSYTPSYLRDTAASRIARETRLANQGFNAQQQPQQQQARPRSEGPLQPLSTNWKAQIAARSPYTSPSAQRQKPSRDRKQPTLIKNLGGGVAKTEKGMTYNPHTLRWEGNENTLTHFDVPPPLQTPTPMGHHHTDRHATSYMDRHHAHTGSLTHHHQHNVSNVMPPIPAPPAFGPAASPPRPALIAPMSAAGGVQVNGGMVFDPRQMKWLKLKGKDARNSNRARAESGSAPWRSPPVTDGGDEHMADAGTPGEDEDDEEDAFAGIDDLKDDDNEFPGGARAGRLGGSVMGTGPGEDGMGSTTGGAGGAGVGDVHEEFDLGPNFIRLQRDEEAAWRKRCELWFPAHGTEPRNDGEAWRWAIRNIIPAAEV